MLKEGRFGTFEATWVIALFCCAKLILLYPMTAIYLAGSAAWLFSIVAASTALIGLQFIKLLLKRFKGQTIVEAGISAAGPFFGSAAAVLYLALFVLSSSLVLRQLTEAVKMTTLPNTPTWFIMIVFLGASMYCASLGIEVVARVTSIIAVSTLILLIVIGILLIPQYDTKMLFPILGKGTGQLLLWGTIKSSNFSEALFAGLIVYPLQGYKNAVKSAKNAILISLVMTAIVTAVCVMTLGPYQGEEAYLTALRSTKNIMIGRFFQRMESVGTMYLSIGLYAIIATFARTFKLPHYKPLIPAFGILVLTISKVPHDFASSANIEVYGLRIYSGIVAYIVPLLLFITAVIRRKKSRTKQCKEGTA